MNIRESTKYLVFYFMLMLATVLVVPALAEEDHSHHHHHAMMEKSYTKNKINYKIPEVTLTRSDGKRVQLANELNDDRIVVLNFIYTTCTAICPVMTQTFSTFEKQLGPEAKKVHLISISIDPEQDTPKRLSDYAKQYEAGPEWSFYTGRVEESIVVQKGFAAYRGDKMNHSPLFLIRSAAGKPWLRLDGFVSPDELMMEFKNALAEK